MPESADNENRPEPMEESHRLFQLEQPGSVFVTDNALPDERFEGLACGVYQTLESVNGGRARGGGVGRGLGGVGGVGRAGGEGCCTLLCRVLSYRIGRECFFTRILNP